MSSATLLPDARHVQQFSSEMVPGQQSSPFFSVFVGSNLFSPVAFRLIIFQRLLQPSPRDRFLKLRKAVEVSKQVWFECCCTIFDRFMFQSQSFSAASTSADSRTYHTFRGASLCPRRGQRPFARSSVCPRTSATCLHSDNSHCSSTRFSGNSLGVWRLDKDAGSGSDTVSGGSSRTPRGGLRKNGKDTQRPITADTTTTENEAENAKPHGPVFADHIEFVDEVFKNRFV